MSNCVSAVTAFRSSSTSATQTPAKQLICSSPTSSSPLSSNGRFRQTWACALPCCASRVRGDRGPSALDWAILEGRRRWGVTLIEATNALDGGPICLTLDATRERSREWP